jgi:uncharacterized membrane protein YhaH (DUF805 family)
VRNILSPHGRTRRTNYIIGLIGINVVGVAIRGVVAGSTPGEASMGFVVTALLLWPLYCLMTRRLHDADRTSIQAILTLCCAVVAAFFAGVSGTLAVKNDLPTTISLFASLALVLSSVSMMVMTPTRGANRYGDDPRKPTTDSEGVIA